MLERRMRYQSGSLTRERRNAGPDVWIFRWREDSADGRRKRKVVVGTIEQFPTKTAARHYSEVQRLRTTINDSPSGLVGPRTVGELIRALQKDGAVRGRHQGLQHEGICSLGLSEAVDHSEVG